MKQLLKEMALSFAAIISVALLAMVIAFSLPLQAQSSELELTIGGWSKHLGAPDGYDKCSNGECKRAWDWKHYYNEQHQTVAVKYKNWEVGTLINSHHTRSVIASWVKRVDVNEYFSYGIRLGGATGYPDKPISPIVQPHILIYYKSIGVELGWLPDLNSQHKYGVATLTGKVRF